MSDSTQTADQISQLNYSDASASSTGDCANTTVQNVAGSSMSLIKHIEEAEGPDYPEDCP